MKRMLRLFAGGFFATSTNLRLRRVIVGAVLTPLSLLATVEIGAVHSQQSAASPHQHIQTLSGNELNGLVSLTGSEDGKFLYGAALSGKLVTLSRDEETGNVEVIDSIGGLRTAVCLAISKDQKWVVLTSCQARFVILCSRDAKTGRLTEVSRMEHGVDGVTGLEFPIAVTISPDSRFVYVTNSGGAGSLTAFSIEDDKLKFLQEHEGIDGSMQGARLLAVDPDGEFLFVACAQADCMTVFDRDTENGHLRVLNHLQDGTEGCNLLEGVHGVACSDDGRHLYVSSGRFSGDNGITVFEILQREMLEFVQELEGGQELENFKAGNFIRISPDGKYVYATGAESGNVLCLERDDDSGRLRYLHEFQVAGETDLGMTADIFVSSDNRFVYVAGEGKDQLYVFERQLEEDEAEENLEQDDAQPEDPEIEDIENEDAQPEEPTED